MEIYTPGTFSNCDEKIVIHVYLLFCKAKRLYLLTCKISIYCPSELQGNVSPEVWCLETTLNKGSKINHGQDIKIPLCLNGEHNQDILKGCIDQVNTECNAAFSISLPSFCNIYVAETGRWNGEFQLQRGRRDILPHTDDQRSSWRSNHWSCYVKWFPESCGGVAYICRKSSRTSYAKS